MVDAAILSKIQKLLKLAADRSTTADEAALAAERAQALLYKHNLTLADVADAEGIVDLDRLGTFEPWRQVLAANLAKHNRCRILMFQGGLKFIGKPADIEIVLYLHTYLSRTIQRVSTAAWAAHVAQMTDPILGLYPSLQEPGAKKGWIESFRIGAAEMIAIRLDRQAKAEAARRDFEARALVASTEKEALVRVTEALAKWDARLQAYIDGKFSGRVKPREFEATIEQHGFTEGVLKGKSIALRRGLGVGTPRKRVT